MIGAVDQRGPQVDHWIAGQDTGLHGLLDALVHRRDVLPWDGPPHDLVDELVAASRPGWLEVDHRVPVLAPAARLADVAGLDLVDRLADGLAVRHLRLADVGPNVELPGQPVDQYLQVELAHP